MSASKIQSAESLQNENKRLEMLNAELKTQNQALRGQIDSSLKITERFQAIVHENSDLKTKLRVSLEEKENLEKRFQINLQQIQELKDKFNRSQEIFGKKDVSSNENENELQKKLNQLNDKMMLDEIKYEQVVKTKEKYESDFNQIFEKSSLYFNDDIKCVTDLLAHLEKPNDIDQKSNESDKQSVNSSVVLDSKIFNYKRKVKKLKKFLQLEVKKCKKLENEYNSKFKKLTNQNELKMIEINSQIEKLKLSLEQQNKLNNELTARNEIICKENAKLESQLQLARIKTTDTESEKVIQLSRQITDLNEKINELSDMNQEFKNNRIPSLSAKNRELKNKLSSTLDRISQLKELLSDEKSKSSILTEQFERRSVELTERVSQREVENSKLKHEIEKVKLNLIDVSRENQYLKQETETLKDEKDNVMKILKQHKEMNQKYENQLFEYSQKITQINTELENTKTKLFVASQPVDLTKLVPLACWSVPEIPDDLSAIVDGIVKNGTIELPTKLRHVLSVICKWFTSKSDRLEQDLESSNSSISNLRSIIDTTKEFLRQTFPDYKEDFKDIVDENDQKAKELFRSYVEKKEESFKDLFEVKSKMDENLLDLLLALKVDKIHDAQKKVEKIYAKIKKLKKALIKSNQINNKIAENSTKEIKTLNNNLKTKNILIEEIQGKNNILTESLAKAEETIKDLEAKLSETKEKLHQYTQQTNETIQNSNEKYATLNDKFDESQKKISELESQVDDLHYVINDLTNTKKETDEYIDNFKKGHENTILSYKQKIKEIKKQGKDRYDSMLNQMKKQNAECREMMSNVNNQNTILREKNELLENQITELNLKIQKYEMKATAMSADNERDRRAQESNYTARLMALRNEYQNQVDALQNDKKKIVDLLSLEFSKFVKVDEKNVEDAIKTIGDKLNAIEM